MSFYTDYADIRVSGGAWILAADLIWEIGKKGSGLAFCVKAGFQSDLATIPWWARPLFNPADPRFAKAAILHDAMLAVRNFSRRTAATEFTEALLADGVSRWRAEVMGLAVWGWTALKKPVG